MAPRDLFCGYAVLGQRHTGILPHSLMKKLGFELIGAELLVEHFHTTGGFAEAAGTEAPNCAKGMLNK